MKKTIYFFGVIFLSTIILLNIIYTATLDSSEHITIKLNSLIYIAGLIIGGTLLYFCSKLLDKYLYDNETRTKIRKWTFGIVLAIYIIFNIIWLIKVNPPVGGDQIHAVNLAQTFYRGNPEEFLPNLTYAGIPLSQYMQTYNQQITLAFVFSVFFRIIHFDAMEILRGVNLIGNVLIIVALYKICNQLSKEYKTNKVLLMLLILTFFTLPIISNFIYGDVPSLALCLFAVYFTMKYTETEKIRYIVFTTILTMIAYMMRMNSLIFIIATVIYLILNIFKNIEEKSWKKNLLSVAIIIMYVVISIVPSSIVTNYYLDKYNLERNKPYPNIGYVLMAMQEGPRANGWYNEATREKAFDRLDNISDEYKQEIKERIKYFLQNPGYTIKFYIDKITSMWAENTYSAIRNSEVNGNLDNLVKPLEFYQKVLLILTCGCSLIVLIQNRKNLSLNLIFLITIFIGGFAFHILWEAKSRYIIPYILVLIPVSTIVINKKLKNKEEN